MKSEPKVVGHVVSMPPLVGTPTQEIENAVFWAYHLGHITMAQGITALGKNYQHEHTTHYFLALFNDWKYLVRPPEGN